jgi:hypothetical protein
VSEVFEVADLLMGKKEALLLEILQQCSSSYVGGLKTLLKVLNLEVSLAS